MLQPERLETRRQFIKALGRGALALGLGTVLSQLPTSIGEASPIAIPSIVKPIKGHSPTSNVLVEFHPGVNREAVIKELSRNARLTDEIRDLDIDVVSSDYDSRQLARMLERTGTVVYAEPEWVTKVLDLGTYHPLKASLDNKVSETTALGDPFEYLQWDFGPTGRGSIDPATLINNGVIIPVGIADGAPDANHIDLQGLFDLSKSYDWVGNQPGIPLDLDPHATGLAGLGAWTGNNEFIAGYSINQPGTQRTSLIAFKIMQNGFVDGIPAIKAMNDAAVKCAGGIFFMANEGIDTDNNSLRKAYRNLVAHDVLVATAAGNTGDKTHQSYPGAYPLVANIGAYDRYTLLVTDFSDKGDAYGPGTSVYSLWPGNRLSGGTGTSIAVAAFAHSASLIRGQFPFLTAKDTLTLFKDNSDQMEDGSGDTRFNVGKTYTAARIQYGPQLPI